MKCVKIMYVFTLLEELMNYQVIYQMNYMQQKNALKNNTGVRFNVAVNYGGRDEIVTAVKKYS